MVNPKSKIQSLKSEATLELVSGSVEETQALGERLGRTLRGGDVVALYGELGSGKTTLIQGMARGMGRDPDTIKSPTFVLMREYPSRSSNASAGAGGSIPLIHIDGYRLEGAPLAAWLDVDLIFAPHKVTLIEWADRFEGLMPEERLEVWLEHVSTNRRRLQVVAIGARARDIIPQLQMERTHETLSP